MRSRLGLVALSLLLVSCQKVGVQNGGGDDTFAPFSFALRDQLTPLGRIRRLVDNSLLQGLFMSEVEIVAYDYRPNKKIQSQWLGHGDRPQNPFSFWVVLQNGHEAGANNVLKVGEKLDLDQYNGEIGAAFTGLSEEFVNSVGSFNVDLFEIYIHTTGIVYNNTYYGPYFGSSTVPPLEKYPAWSAFPGFQAGSSLAGLPAGSANTLSILFARNDWFPSPVFVELSLNARAPSGYGGDPAVSVVSSSVPLTAKQNNLLLSWVTNGTWRRGYRYVAVVPYDGPVKIKMKKTEPPPSEDLPAAAADQGAIAALPSDVPVSGTPGTGGGTSKPQLTYVSRKLNVNVDFDLANALHTSSDLDTTTSTKDIRFKVDANNIPFGLKIDFSEAE